MRYLIRNGLLVTMDPNRTVVKGDLLIEGGRIAAIGDVRDGDAPIIEADGMAVIPGLIQTHIHSCQTLFRGLADDMPLLEWLRSRIWPFEAAHDPESLYISSMLGFSELLLGGTTTVVDMATVHHTGSVFQAAVDSGIRANIGKALMDMGAGVPPGLIQSTDAALRDWEELHARYDGTADGRISSSLAPRFVLSCSRPLLEEVARLSREKRVIVQTHASENRDECRAVEEVTSMGNVEYLHDVGLTGPNVIFAHCIWLSPKEVEILRSTGTVVAHCPSSNLKLASGIAGVHDLMSKGVTMTVGADGAPCTNNLDGFLEMRLAALLQKPPHGAKALPAAEAFELLTVKAARALGKPDIGSLELGMCADVAVVNLSGCHQPLDPAADIYSTLVYSSKATDVRHVWVDGRMVVKGGRLLTADVPELVSRGRTQLRSLLDRVNGNV